MSLLRLGSAPSVRMARPPQTGAGLTWEQREMMRKANAITAQTGQARRAIAGQATANNKNSFDQFLRDTKVISKLGTAALGAGGTYLGGPTMGAAAGSLGGYALRQTGYGAKKRRKAPKKRKATRKRK